MRKTRAKSGQVALFMLLVFTAILLTVLVNFDVFTAVLRKEDVQNAGDAAALAAARWQATTLNLEGELNLIHALAVCTGETNAIPGINAMQARLAFAGPLAGLAAAQTAARQNHAFDDPGAIAMMREHSLSVRSMQTGGDGYDAYPEPWPGAWAEYADMIDAASGQGLAAVPGNTRYFDTAGGHTLLDRSFYMAVNGRDWCWFFFNAMPLLRGYRSFSDWDPLPERERGGLWNSEIFGLEIEPADVPLAAFMDAGSAAELLGAVPPRGSVRSEDVEESGLMFSFPQRWYVYGREAWGRWTAFDPFGENRFPAAGRVKPEYDVDGAAAVCRVRGEINPSSPGLDSKAVHWLAAAKPFGYLEDGETGGRAPATSAGGYILPAFRAVRLVPVDTARGADLATADASWVAHVRRHLKPYMAHGPSAAAPHAQAGCAWCEALVLWERAEFRDAGVEWLRRNSRMCRRTGGGPGGSGGTAHGH